MRLDFFVNEKIVTVRFIEVENNNLRWIDKRMRYHLSQIRQMTVAPSAQFSACAV